MQNNFREKYNFDFESSLGGRGWTLSLKFKLRKYLKSFKFIKSQILSSPNSLSRGLNSPTYYEKSSWRSNLITLPVLSKVRKLNKKTEGKLKKKRNHTRPLVFLVFFTFDSTGGVNLTSKKIFHSKFMN